MRPTILIFDYVCATCWSQLIEAQILGEWKVVCSAYGILHAGYHRRETAIRGRELSIKERAEFIALYIDTEFAVQLGLKKPPVERTPDEWREVLRQGKQALGRDDGGLF